MILNKAIWFLIDFILGSGIHKIYINYSNMIYGVIITNKKNDLLGTIMITSNWERNSKKEW